MGNKRHHKNDGFFLLLRYIVLYTCYSLLLCRLFISWLCRLQWTFEATDKIVGFAFLVGRKEEAFLEWRLDSYHDYDGEEDDNIL